jgi:L-arabinose isomerase
MELQWPAHHCAIGIGHLVDQVDKLARLLGLGCIKVC